jgi:hypothetical protein
VAAPVRNSEVVTEASARPERQGFPSALRGLDSGLAAAGEQVRQPLAASARRARAAVLLGDEVAVDRASTGNALEAQTLEDSHASCCHRSGEQGIADLHPPTRRSHRRGAQASDAEVDGARQEVADQPSRDGGVGGSVQDRRRGARRRTPSTGGPGDPGAPAGRRRARGEERPAGCPPAEQSVLADRTSRRSTSRRRRRGS